MTPYRHQLLAAPALAALLAGCGGSNSFNAGGHPPSAQSLQAVLNFTTWVRSHGVPNIPDPGTPGWKNALASQAPAVLAAERTCERLVPGAGPSSLSQSKPQSPARTAAMLAFAHCLRSHGFPSFPDPTSGGQLTHQMIAAAGINLRQPAVLQAGDACVSVTHGRVTKTAVARFVAGQ